MGHYAICVLIWEIFDRHILNVELGGTRGRVRRRLQNFILWKVLDTSPGFHSVSRLNGEVHKNS